MPSDSDVQLKALLELADEVIAAKAGLRDECVRAKSEDVSFEELLGPDNVEFLNAMRADSAQQNE